MVYEVASFYAMYDLKPKGHHKISVCCSISCLLCGSKKVIDYLQTKLGIHVGETTKDGRFTLKKAECLAACAGGPMLMIDDKHYHEQLTPQKIDRILSDLEPSHGASD